MKTGSKIYGISAPSRATTLINYLGLNADTLECILEIEGSKKINHYLPGTDIPIHDEKKLYVNQPEYQIGAMSVNYGDATSSLGNDGSDLGRGYGDIIKAWNQGTIAGKIYKLQSNGNITAADKDGGASDSALLGVALGTNTSTDGLFFR